DDTGYSGPTLDLSAYATGGYNFTFGPEYLPGGITFTAAPENGGNSGHGSVIGQGSYSLSGNGDFGGDAIYIGVDSGSGYAELSFAAPVSSFGGYWNYAPSYGDAPTLSAYDSAGILLGAFDLEDVAPISTPGVFNGFAFRGLVSDTTDISAVRFGGSYILLAATPDGTPMPIAPAIPLPAGFPLLLGGLSVFGLLRHRRASA
ncbi:MAG: VPLPA-CTERM sorting domain-containing protein, partial [Qingshengfaniella sp.]